MRIDEQHECTPQVRRSGVIQKMGDRFGECGAYRTSRRQARSSDDQPGKRRTGGPARDCAEKGDRSLERDRHPERGASQEKRPIQPEYQYGRQVERAVSLGIDPGNQHGARRDDETTNTDENSLAE